MAIASSYPREVLAETAHPPHWIVGDYDEFLDGPGAPLTADATGGVVTRR